MSKILLSINPEHVGKIFDGSKCYEFRKTKCRKKIDKIIIYSTHPEMKVVGEADVEFTLECSPSKMWEQTQTKAGIDREFFNEYYNGKDNAIAYRLSNVRKFEKPRDLSEYNVMNAPQSFRYLD